MKSNIVLLIACMVTYTTQAQTSNPFKAINKKAKMVTLSDGKYVESFDDDVMQRIGSVIIDTRTKKIVYIMNSDSLSALASDNTTASRWLSLDPLAQKYPSLSPYNFCANNPILLIDLDGRVIGNPNDPHVKEYKAAMLKTPTGKDVWNKMEQSTRTIYIYTAGKDKEGLAIFRHLQSGGGKAGAGGEVVSEKNYNAIIAGKDYNSSADYNFNPNTGLYNKNSNFDNSVILIDPSSFAGNLVPFILTDPTDYSNQEYADMGILVTVGEEASHSVQNYADFTKRHKNSKTGKYDEKGGEQNYTQRKNEIDAKKDAAKMVDEYKESKNENDSKKDEH